MMASDWQTLPHHSFGDGPALADELLALVLAGTKTATCWDARDGMKKSATGGCWVVRDGTGQPRAVLETIELTLRALDEVDADFAVDEGEGDLTLGWWQDMHRAFFKRQGHYAPDMAVWCERFRLVRVL